MRKKKWFPVEFSTVDESGPGPKSRESKDSTRSKKILIDETDVKLDELQSESGLDSSSKQEPETDNRQTIYCAKKDVTMT